MGRKVKCAFCGNQLDSEDCYVVFGKSRNKYYCSFEHATSKTPRQQFFELTKEVIGVVSSTVFYNDMDQLAKIHSYNKMILYLQDNKNEIQKYMNKDFDSSFGKIKYFRAILANNLDDYKHQEFKPEIKKEANMEIYEAKSATRKGRKGIDNLLDDLI